MTLEQFQSAMGTYGEISKLSLCSTYENGNHYVAIFNDGTKVKETKDEADKYFTYNFAENCDVLITRYCDANCAYCHEGATTKGKHGDLKKFNYIWDSLRAGTEMAIGGGNALAHPDLEWFLKKLKSKGVLANITVNQFHLAKYFHTLKKYVKEGLINGIGLSLINSKDFPANLVDELGNNVVIHTIAGILTEDDFKVLQGRKVLVLGYKDLRRGHSFLSDTVKSNIAWLKDNISKLASITKVLSFDCLGIEQLDPKNNLNISDESWNTLFQGSDTDVKDENGNTTCCTFYIDVVEETCARMSTAALDKRFKIEENDNIVTLFEKSTQAW